MARLNPRRWFLPETPDVLGLLRRQLAVTIEGADLLTEWSSGAAVASGDLRAVQARGEQSRRDLLSALEEAFITPLEPEDLYAISRGTGRILSGIADLVGEAEVLECSPDDGLASMAKLLTEAVRQIDVAVAGLGPAAVAATTSADLAIETVRQMQSPYYAGMATTLNLDDRGTRIARRELYRRCSRIGDIAVDVAERVVYSVVKQS